MKHTVHGYKGPRKTVWFISTSLSFNFDKQSDYKALEGGGKTLLHLQRDQQGKPPSPPLSNRARSKWRKQNKEIAEQAKTDTFVFGYI